MDQENLRQTLGQSNVKLKQISTWSFPFSRARDRLVMSVISRGLLVSFNKSLFKSFDYFCLMTLKLILHPI